MGSQIETGRSTEGVGMDFPLETDLWPRSLEKLLIYNPVLGAHGTPPLNEPLNLGSFAKSNAPNRRILEFPASKRGKLIHLNE